MAKSKFFSAFKRAGLIAVMTIAGVVVSSSAQAVEPDKAMLARWNDYMNNIVPVYFPAVPFGWKISIDNNVVTYSNAVKQKVRNETTMKGTFIKMRYTRKTSRMDASRYMDSYMNAHACTEKIEQGKGFYTTSCVTTNTYAIVIGEVDNMYIIELTGDYNNAARAIIENYVGSIVRGKRVFADRSIGEITPMN